MSVPTKPGSRQPDYFAFYSQGRSSLRDLFASPLPDDLTIEYFQMSTRAFFVNAPGLSHALAGSISLLQKQAGTLLTPPSQPSRKELDTLRRGDAMSLFSILRIHECFAAMGRQDTPIRPVLREVELLNGLPPNCIVPSVWRFDQSRYESLLREFRISASEVPRALLQISRRPKPDLMKLLAQGYVGSGGARSGAYRVTDTLASLISDAIAEAARGEMSARDIHQIVFDPRASRGPGHGTMTQALPRELGNVVVAPSDHRYRGYFYEGGDGRIAAQRPSPRDPAELLSVRSDDAGTWIVTRAGAPRISCFLPPGRDAATVFWPHRGAEAPFVRYFRELSDQQPHWGQTVKFFRDDELIVDEPDDDPDNYDPPELLPGELRDDWESGARSVSMELAPRSKNYNERKSVVWYSLNGREEPEAGVALSIDMLQRQTNRLASLIAVTHRSQLGASATTQALQVLTAIQNRPQL